MRKIIVLTFLLFLSFVLIAEGQETKTITYLIDGKQKTVKAVFIGWQKTRLFIEGDYTEEWLIAEKAFKPINGDWTEYERHSETPFPFLTNSKMDNLETEAQKTKYNELEIEGMKVLLVRIPNDKNQMSWWEGRKYLYYIQELYIIQ